MSEQAVKDAKAKRDAAQADLDKAVADTKDEIQKAADAVKDAAPEKAVDVKPAPPKPEAPAPVHYVPVPAAAPISDKSTTARLVVIGLIVLAVVGYFVARMLHLVS